MAEEALTGSFSAWERLLVRELYNDYPAWLDTDTLAADGCYGRITADRALGKLLSLRRYGVVTCRRKAGRELEWQLTKLAYELVRVGDVRR